MHISLKQLYYCLLFWVQYMRMSLVLCINQSFYNVRSTQMVGAQYANGRCAVRKWSVRSTQMVGAQYANGR